MRKHPNDGPRDMYPGPVVVSPAVRTDAAPPPSYGGGMARLGGRNTVFAWFVGIVCAAIVVTIAVIAAPLFPAATTWFTAAAVEMQRFIDPDSVPAADAEPDPTPTADAGATVQCRDLYDEAVWTALRLADGSALVTSTEAPTTSASALVDALQPEVTLTCAWTSEAGMISTTLARVPMDAGAVARASLPGSGFTCEDDASLVRCTRTDGALVETIEADGGRWLSTSRQGWDIATYEERVSRHAWAIEG